MYKFAVFDLDGTLLDSMGCWRNVIPIYAELKGIKCSGLSDEELRKTDTMSCDDAVEYMRSVSNDPALKNFTYSDMLYVMDECYRHRTPVRAGVPDMLKGLKEKGVRMCVISATPTRLVKTALSTAELIDYFEFILTPDDYPAGKNTPDIFMAAAKNFGCKTGDMAIFEDTYYSMRTAKGLGMHVIAVEDRFEAYERDKIKDIADEYYKEFTEYRYK